MASTGEKRQTHRCGNLDDVVALLEDKGGDNAAALELRLKKLPALRLLLALLLAENGREILRRG